MPTYEFQCPNNHITEQVHHSFTITIVPCEICGESAARLISRYGGFTMDPEDRGGHV